MSGEIPTPVEIIRQGALYHGVDRFTNKDVRFLLEEITRLRTALHFYATHRWTCAAGKDERFSCTCGLAEALKS